MERVWSPAPAPVLATRVLLRIALAGVALTIISAIVAQSLLTGGGDGCFLASVSAYWFTDARAVFVGGLVAIGVCLVVYDGGTWTENLLLNLAGVLAPFVAFVPTTLAKDVDLACLGLSAPPTYDAAAPDTALVAYFAALLAGAAVTLVLSGRRLRSIGDATRAMRWAVLVGNVLGIGLVVGMLGWWLLDDRFAPHAHFPSAALMFVFLTVVVACRTERVSRLTRRWDLYRDDEVRDRLQAMQPSRRLPYARLYGLIAGLMAAALLFAVVNLVTELWTYWVIGVEIALLALFLAFWALQTVQLLGLRTHRGEVCAPAAAAPVPAPPPPGEPGEYDVLL